MTSLTDSSDDLPVKIICIGESGAGKSGAKAALIAAGYKIRSIDTDNGNRILRALLTDADHYPYAKLIRDRGIDLTDAFDYITVATPMAPRSITHQIKNQNGSYSSKVDTVLAPKDGRAWGTIMNLLNEWKDPRGGRDTKSLGHVMSWGPDTILDLDSFTTISRQAYYSNQEFNGRLGSPEDGHTHMRDVGGAQSQLRRLLETLFNPDLHCHVILNCHIFRLDDSRGFNQTPEARRLEDPSALIEVKGFPQSIGLAMSKQVGIYFNDSFVFDQRGSGTNTRRIISTVPTTISGVTVSAKNSAFLKPEYDQRTGLAEIFAALRGQPEPTDLINAIRGAPSTRAQPVRVA